MKKLSLSFVLLFISATLFVSCTKEGPAGPQGIQGTQGIQGIQGVPGNNAIVVKNVSISAWTPTTAALFHTGTATVPEITNNIINGGAVLAYMVSGTTLFAMPYTLLDSDVSWRHSISLNTFNAERNRSVSSPAPASAVNFRLIIIPGSLGARTSGVNGYSLQQLQSMTYEQACKVLNIKP